VESEDPYDLLLIGDVAGSCQNILSNSDNNRGVLGTLKHGQTHLLAIKHKKTEEVPARLLMRHLFDEHNNTVVFLERPYPVGQVPAPLLKALLELGKEKALQMNAPLYAVHDSIQLNDLQAQRRQMSLRALGGPAPCEYSDLAQGLKTNGKFSTTADCDLLYSPPSIKLTVKTKLKYGQNLYMRGEGGNLTWDKSLKLDWTPDGWVIEAPAGLREFKFLIDDKTWERGPNHKIQQGISQTTLENIRF